MAKSYLPAKTANERENDPAYWLAVEAFGHASCVHRRRGNPEAVAAGGGNLECGRWRETEGVWREPAGPATDRLLPEDHLWVGRAKARRAAQAGRTRMEKAGASAIAKSRFGGARVTTLRWGHVTDGRKAAGMRTPRGLRLPWGFSRLCRLSVTWCGLLGGVGHTPRNGTDTHHHVWTPRLGQDPACARD